MRFLVNNRNPDGGVSYHRLQQPFINSDFDYTHFSVPQEVDITEYTHLVFNRSFGWQDTESDEKFIRICKDAGLKVIIDIDDYWELPDYHTIVWRPDVNYKEWQNAIIQNLKLADYVWTSTDRLAARIREVVSVPVVVCKNALNYDLPMWTEPKKKVHKEVNFGWVGSTTHHMDVDQLRRPLAAMNKNHKIWTHLTGYMPPVDLLKLTPEERDQKRWASEVSERFLKMFTNEGRYKNTDCHLPVPINEYGFIYTQLDVSLGPVIDNEFNRCKSELKIIEAGARKIPFIGSNVMTYSRVEADCFDLCDDAQEWYESMRDYMNPNLRKELGQELHDFVREEYTFEKSNACRISIL